MSTSGSINFNETGSEIVTDAYGHLGVLEEGEDLSDSQLQIGLKALNKQVKGIQAKGYHIWGLQEATLLLTKSATSYTFPTAHCSDTVVQTTLSADEASGQTILSITSTTGMTVSGNIGIELDDGTLHWTTIFILSSSAQVIVNDSLASVASSGNYVYYYTTKINRPLGITEARHVLADGTEVPAWVISRNEYMLLPNKTVTGKMVQVYYDRQLSTGILNTWPTAESVRDRVKFTYKRSLEDFDNTGDNPDLPAEWLECLSWGLAWRLGPREQVNPQSLMMLKAVADEMLTDMMQFDDEDVPMTFEYED